MYKFCMIVFSQLYDGAICVSVYYNSFRGVFVICYKEYFAICKQAMCW